MTGGARRRSETYEIVFFIKKTLLFRCERVKTKGIATIENHSTVILTKNYVVKLALYFDYLILHEYNVVHQNNGSKINAHQKLTRIENFECVEINVIEHNPNFNTTLIKATFSDSR